MKVNDLSPQKKRTAVSLARERFLATLSNIPKNVYSMLIHVFLYANYIIGDYVYQDVNVILL